MERIWLVMHPFLQLFSCRRCHGFMNMLSNHLNLWFVDDHLKSRATGCASLVESAIVLNIFSGLSRATLPLVMKREPASKSGVVARIGFREAFPFRPDPC